MSMSGKTTACGGFVGGWSDMEILMRIDQEKRQKEREQRLERERQEKEQERLRKIELEKARQTQVAAKIGSKHWSSGLEAITEKLI